MSDELNHRQRIFVAHIVKGTTAKDAAIAAGYSEKTAESQGSRLLRNAKVAEAVEAGLKRKISRLEFTGDDVLQELARGAFADIREAFDEHGNLKNIQDIPANLARIIGTIEVKEEWGVSGDGRTRVPMGEVKKVKPISKEKCLELLAKHFGLIKDRVEHSVDKKLEDLINESLKVAPIGTKPEEATPAAVPPQYDPLPSEDE